MNKNQKGFTLIELMIVTAIIGLLAAVALPAYTSQVQQSRRSDVMELLTDCAAAQARHFTSATPPVYLDQAGVLANNLCNSGTGVAFSKDGHYSLVVTNVVNGNNCPIIGGDGVAINDAGGTPGFSCFLLTATAVAAGVQSGDTTCTTWTIDHRGVQTAVDGAAADTTDRCWRS